MAIISPDKQSNPARTISIRGRTWFLIPFSEHSTMNIIPAETNESHAPKEANSVDSRAISEVDIERQK
jgi:hypothetical protein